MDKARVGVFVCYCGSDIGGVVDVPELVEYARSLPNVEFVRDTPKACTDAGQQEIVQDITEHGLNRVVLAGCTPRTHEPLFRVTCQQAGLNPYLLEFVNLRDHCSRVHAGESEQATAKAKDLVRMGVARAIFLEPLSHKPLPVTRAALVIGGGIAGLSAALNLANQGFEVKLVEREPEMGGLLRDVYKLYPTGDLARTFVEEKVAAVRSNPNIEVLIGAEVRDVTGVVGNYEVMVAQGEQELQFQVGVIIVATGAKEFRPTGMFGYDGQKVITQGELETRLAEGIADHDPPIRSVAMIQCVGARDETRPYCSRICCMTAVKNALLIKETNPGIQVYVLYRDMLTLGVEYEDLYREARGKGVIFIQYDPQRPPHVDGGHVRVYDELLGEALSIPCDLVVLSTPLVAQPDAVDLAQMLQVPIDEHGFFLESHLKYRPLDSDNDGIFLCGSAHWPSDVGESVTQALGAAARGSILLRQNVIEIEPTVAVVDITKCSACGLCELTCNYHAVEVTVVDERRGIKAARVNEVLCKGCGACAAGCRCRAIDLRGSTNEQILAAINAF